MKKKEFRAGNKVVSILCIIAIVVTIILQFVPYWSYTGIIENKEISEERAVEMESSIAGYCWLPNSETSNAFEDYVKDPTTFYAEEVETVEYDEEELAAVMGAVAALDEEPIDEAAAEETTDAAEEEETTEATVEEVTEEVAEATEEETAEEATEATEETAEEAAEEEDEFVPVDEGEVVLTKGMLVTIKQHKRADSDITDVDKKVKDAYKGLNENEFVNTLTGAPVMAFVISIICLAVIIIFMFKKAYVPAILTVVAGVYHWVTYSTHLIFKLSDKCGTFQLISLIIAVVGLVLVAYDLRIDLKERKAKKEEAELQESMEA